MQNQKQKSYNIKIRNYFISNLSLFEELLIRKLIYNQISYVKINHEFHFLDYIIRLYDMNEINTETISFNNDILITLSNIEKEEIESVYKLQNKSRIRQNIKSIKSNNKKTNSVIKNYQKIKTYNNYKRK